MVNMKFAAFRPAIAMIELIFAIVIMGIVMMSAPQLISTATKSGYVTIQQEGVSQAASRVNMIMGYPWDEANVDDSTYNILLQTSSPVSDLNESNRTVGVMTVVGYRRGTPMQSLRNFKAPGTPPWLQASLVNEGDEDDMDDFAGSLGLKLEGAGTGSDYIEENATITTTISFLADNTNETGYSHNNITFDFDNPATSSTSSIKGITVILTSDSASPDELNKTITLKAFSCNIGGYELERRSF